MHTPTNLQACYIMLLPLTSGDRKCRLRLAISYCCWTLTRPMPSTTSKRKAYNWKTVVSCGCNEETSSHLFLHCLTARIIWAEFLQKFHISWVILVSLPSMFESWFNGPKGSLSPRGRVLWSSIPHVICWSI